MPVSRIALAAFIVILCNAARAQDPASDISPDTETAPERWNLYYQATSIGDYHGTFPSPYEARSACKTIRSATFPHHNAFFHRSAGAEHVSDFRSGDRGRKRVQRRERHRQSAQRRDPARGQPPTPKPYLARLFIQHDFGFGSGTEHQESDENQLAGDRPMTRYSIYAGRFTVTDYFDNNNYTHDPRTQFMAWGVMYNGAWDYPADTRGYTWGIVQEFHTRKWALRYGIAAEPKVANGSQFDRRLVSRSRPGVGSGAALFAAQARGRGSLTGLRESRAGGKLCPGAEARGGNGNHARREPDRRVGTLKYGTGISFDQAHFRQFRRVHRAWDGTTARPRASRSPPSTVWRAAAFR